jgi:hypothetical protein
MNKREPPCATCFPGINPNNLEAWEVFQKACAEDSMGISAYGIEMACNDLQVRDRLECKMKVKEVIAELRRVEDKEQEKEHQRSAPIPSFNNPDKVFG